MLGATIPMNRTVRDLNRLRPGQDSTRRQRLQVHRLVQRVLRDSLSADLADQTLRNAQQPAGRGNPGRARTQEDARTASADMGPHIDPADLIHAPNLDARQAVLDHVRYLYATGDYENSRLLAERAARAWSPGDMSHPRLGPDGEMTLRARGRLANANRGRSAAAARPRRARRETLRTDAGEPAMGPAPRVHADHRQPGRDTTSASPVATARRSSSTASRWRCTARCSGPTTTTRCGRWPTSRWTTA